MEIDRTDFVLFAKYRLWCAFWADDLGREPMDYCLQDYRFVFYSIHTKILACRLSICGGSRSPFGGLLVRNAFTFVSVFLFIFVWFQVGSTAVPIFCSFTFWAFVRFKRKRLLVCIQLAAFCLSTFSPPRTAGRQFGPFSLDTFLAPVRSALYWLRD